MTKQLICCIVMVMILCKCCIVIPIPIPIEPPVKVFVIEEEAHNGF